MIYLTTDSHFNHRKIIEMGRSGEKFPKMKFEEFLAIAASTGLNCSIEAKRALYCKFLKRHPWRLSGNFLSWDLDRIDMAIVWARWDAAELCDLGNEFTPTQLISEFGDEVERIIGQSDFEFIESIIKALNKNDNVAFRITNGNIFVVEYDDYYFMD